MTWLFFESYFISFLAAWLCQILGATYSATAVSIALEMKPETKGMSMTLGRILLRGTTEMVIRGRSIELTIVVLTLSNNDTYG